MAPVENGAGEHGYRYQCDHTGRWCVKPAWLLDNPRMREIQSLSRQTFETTAIAAEGKDKERYYGSVEWGWSWAPGRKVKLIRLRVVTQGYGASAQFELSAKQLNKTPTSKGALPVKIPLQHEDK